MDVTNSEEHWHVWTVYCGKSWISDRSPVNTECADGFVAHKLPATLRLQPDAPLRGLPQ